MTKLTPAQQRQEDLLAKYGTIEKIHAAIGAAAVAVETSRAAPLCVENCGLCCSLNTPYAWDSEARYLVSSNIGQIAEITRRAEAWLLDKHAGLTSEPLSKLRPDQVAQQVQAASRLPCPFLGDDKRCTVYDGRPIPCRAYGVTRMPGKECIRPIGVGETDEQRAYYGGPPAATLRTITDATFRGEESLPLPTAVFRLLEPRKFAEYQARGVIQTAKMVAMARSPSLIWQVQLEEIFRNIEANGDPSKSEAQAQA